MLDILKRFKMLDISKRFKMLNISNRFKIRDFKYVWNVDLWLYSCLASNLLSLLWDFQQYRTLCSCICSWRFKMLDISKRFRMLDISNRFKIRDFKNIWNVDLWLYTYTASSPPSLLWEFERSRTLQFFIGRWLCRSNLWFQIEVEEVVHSYDKLRLKSRLQRWSFFHAMRWRCFIFYNNAISIIFGYSLPLPLRLFLQTIGTDYFAMFV